jgi:hypothetical protein
MSTATLLPIVNRPKPLANESPLIRCWRRHAYILPSFLISILVWSWFVTWGDWKFFEQEDFCGFYDGYARSILHGHLDVPRSAIGVEAFTFESKAYGYFGIGPAVLRIPLVLIFPNMDGLWSRLMILIAAAISLVCAYSILQMMREGSSPPAKAERVLHSLFILSAGIGSSTVFLIGRSFTYHEALMWAGAFALLFTCAILQYFQRPRGRTLVLAGVFSFMSFHCRGTAGAGTLLVMLVIAAILMLRAMGKRDAGRSLIGLIKLVRPARHALIAVISVIISLGVYFGVNYAKFRTFDALPLRYYDFYHQFPIRMRLTGAKQIHLKNIPTGLVTYFGVHGFKLKQQFPWFYLEDEATFIGSPANDVIEPFSTIPVSMPALMLFGVIGSAALISSSDEKLQRARLPALSLFLGGAIVLGTVGITERYLHDFYPALIICAAAGVARVAAGDRIKAIAAATAGLAAVSIVLNCSFSLINQRENFGAPLAKVAEYKQLQQQIHFLGQNLIGSGKPQ